MSGFYTIPKAQGAHQAVPVKDSWYEEHTQLPADFRRESSYPVTAVCQECGGRIRLAQKQQMEWVHAPRGQDGQ